MWIKGESLYIFFFGIHNYKPLTCLKLLWTLWMRSWNPLERTRTPSHSSTRNIIKFEKSSFFMNEFIRNWMKKLRKEKIVTLLKTGQFLWKQARRRGPGAYSRHDRWASLAKLVCKEQGLFVPVILANRVLCADRWASKIPMKAGHRLIFRRGFLGTGVGGGGREDGKEKGETLKERAVVRLHTEGQWILDREA